MFHMWKVKNISAGPGMVASRAVNRYRFFGIDTFETESILGFETFDTFDTDKEKMIYHFHIYSKFFSQLQLQGITSSVSVAVLYLY
jgi:hypothetical protein